jgi:hypothetical protein
VFRARLVVSFFAVLLAVLVFLAAKEMFGTWAGFIALALLAFDPNFLAHGAVVRTDTGLACFLFASLYALYRYVKAPSAGRLVVAALATGLATQRNTPLSFCFRCWHCWPCARFCGATTPPMARRAKQKESAQFVWRGRWCSSPSFLSACSGRCTDFVTSRAPITWR